ncbi:hypothetical protein [Parasutterella excrementihominis]|uniref:hypothetical protein n=1 Tax=Parasutterella excrementihominis TaxID=487175 RepID=UPI00242AFBBA|nr:hypothetical protein [Parasutterella excrementihominis]
MAKDLRLTAIFAVMDQLSPVIKKLSDKWESFRKLLESDNFKKLNKQFLFFRRSLTNVTDQVTSAAKKLALPITAAATAVGFSLSQMMSKFLDTGDAIDKASIRLGIGAERLQSLQYAAKMSGATAEDMNSALGKLNENIAKAAAGKNEELASLFKKLGISLRDANGHVRTAADVLPEFADAIQRNTNSSVRARMAIAAFGDAGQKLIPMLQDGSKGLADMEKRAHDLGLTISQDDVKAAASLGDKFTDLGSVFDSFGNTISAKLAPVLGPLIDDLTEFLAKNKDAFAGRLSEAVSKLSDSLKKVDFEKLANDAMDCFHAIGELYDKIGGFDTILTALAALMAGKVIIAIGSFVGSLLTLGQSFFALIPIIKSVGIAFVANPIGAVITAIAAGAALIISNWDKVGPFFTGLWNGITAIFTGAIKTIENVISGWVDGIKTLWSDLFNGDMSKIVDGFFKIFEGSFSILPDSFKKIGPDLLADAQNILGDIGKKFRDFFGAFDLSDMLPESFKDAIGWLKGKLGWGSNDDKKQAPRPAPAPAGGVYGTAPVAGTQKVQGTMNIEVTAKNGASAEIKNATGSNGLQVAGQVGLSDRIDH